MDQIKAKIAAEEKGFEKSFPPTSKTSRVRSFSLARSAVSAKKTFAAMRLKEGPSKGGRQTSLLSKTPKKAFFFYANQSET